MTRFALASAIFVSILSGQPSPSSAVPKFEDYPAKKFDGVPAKPILATRGQRLYRTMIRAGAEGGPNFAGHYAIARWGCGTACVQMAIVDLQSGKVYDGPFGILPKGSVSFGTGSDQETGIFFQVDSRLLKIRGCPNEENCSEYYYEWTGAGLKLLRRVPIGAL